MHLPLWAPCICCSRMLQCASMERRGKGLGREAGVEALALGHLQAPAGQDSASRSDSASPHGAVLAGQSRQPGSLAMTPLAAIHPSAQAQAYISKLPQPKHAAASTLLETSIRYVRANRCCFACSPAPHLLAHVRQSGSSSSSVSTWHTSSSCSHLEQVCQRLLIADPTNVPPWPTPLLGPSFLPVSGWSRARPSSTHCSRPPPQSWLQQRRWSPLWVPFTGLYASDTLGSQHVARPSRQRSLSDSHQG